MDIEAYKNELCDIVKDIERKAREVCSVKGGQETWSALNAAVREVRNAIYSAWKIEEI